MPLYILVAAYVATKKELKVPIGSDEFIEIVFRVATKKELKAL
mgnify:CR=1 FL=1